MEFVTAVLVVVVLVAVVVVVVVVVVEVVAHYLLFLSSSYYSLYVFNHEVYFVSSPLVNLKYHCHSHFFDVATLGTS